MVRIDRIITARACTLCGNEAGPTDMECSYCGCPGEYLSPPLPNSVRIIDAPSVFPWTWAIICALTVGGFAAFLVMQ